MYYTASDEEFIRMICEKYYYRLFGLAKNLTNSNTDAEDVISIAFERLLKKVCRLRQLEENEVEAYIITTIKHTAYRINKSKNVCEKLPREVIDYSEPDERMIRQCSIDEVSQAIKALDFDDRMIVEMKYFLELTDEEIANSLKIKRSSVRSKLSRVRKKLLFLLEHKQ